MGRKRIGESLAVQDRPGQIPWRNTQGYAVLMAVPEDRFVDSMTVFMEVADKAKIEYTACIQWLCYLAKRDLIEKIPKPGRRSGRAVMQRRKVSIEAAVSR